MMRRRGISKRFGALPAVDGVALEVRGGCDLLPRNAHGMEFLLRNVDVKDQIGGHGLSSLPGVVLTVRSAEIFAIP